MLQAIDISLNSRAVVCAAFLNIQKSSDSLDHVILLQHFHHLGVCGTSSWWFASYLSDHVQGVRSGGSVYVNTMPLQVRHGMLLQFTDDTCLICCGDSFEHVQSMLCDDLTQLSRWITSSKMKFNMTKSSVMWFGVCGRECAADVPAVSLDGVSLKAVTQKKYLGVVIDHKLTWKFQVAKVCKKMAYYLYLISCHQKELPVYILQMLVDSLVLSQLNYVLPVWGPPLSQHLSSRLHRLHNRTVHVVHGL